VRLDQDAAREFPQPVVVLDFHSGRHLPAQIDPKAAQQVPQGESASVQVRPKEAYPRRAHPKMEAHSVPFSAEPQAQQNS
jgi:hypothetical protein